MAQSWEHRTLAPTSRALCAQIWWICWGARAKVKELARGQIQKGPWPLQTLRGWLHKDPASGRNAEPFVKGHAVCTLGSAPALLLSSRADSGLCPQSDLGVAFLVTDFPSSLSQLFHSCYGNVCDCLQWGGSCPEISYLCSLSQCCFSWQEGAVITGGRVWECYQESANLLLPSLRFHTQILVCF